MTPNTFPPFNAVLFNADDIFFPPKWTEALGTRIFPYDVFISHNRFDGSERVAEQLRAHDISVWHDSHADLRDRRVQIQVSKALLASRYIVVWIWSAFRNSHWIKAEYRPGLATEKSGHLTRVLVVTENSDIHVPEDLSGAPRFQVDQLGKLAAYVQDGNRMPFMPELLIQQWGQKRNEAESSAATAVQILEPQIGAPSDNSDCIFANLVCQLPDLRTEVQGSQFSHILFELRNFLGQHIEMLPDPLTLEGQVLRYLSLLATRSPDSDNRANGAMLLRAIDGRWLCDQTLDDLLSCLITETDKGVIHEIAIWLAGAAERLTSDRFDVAEFITVRHPEAFEEPELRTFVERLHEPFRCLVFMGKPLGGLDANEEMTLLEDRLEYLLDLNETTYPEELQFAGPILDISEIEVIIRSLDENILRFYPFQEELHPAVKEDKALLHRVLSAFEKIALENKKRNGQLLRAMEEWILDYMVLPLALYRQISDLWPDAHRVIDDLCTISEASDEIGHEAKCYRLLISMLDRGERYADARKAMQTCMWKTKEEQSRKRWGG